MAREFHADLAATDSTRVLRLPTFVNRKYADEHIVTARRQATATYRLEDFRLREDDYDERRELPKIREDVSVPVPETAPGLLCFDIVLWIRAEIPFTTHLPQDGLVSQTQKRKQHPERSVMAQVWRDGWSIPYFQFRVAMSLEEEQCRATVFVFTTCSRGRVRTQSVVPLNSVAGGFQYSSMCRSARCSFCCD